MRRAAGADPGRRWVLGLASALGVLVVVAGFACGAGAEEGGGFDNLPSRGIGPFERLPEDDLTELEEPTVLSDPDAARAFYGPSALVGDATIFTVYFTAVGNRMLLVLPGGQERCFAKAHAGSPPAVTPMSMQSTGGYGEVAGELGHE